jgi:hypothetical protein
LQAAFHHVVVPPPGFEIAGFGLPADPLPDTEECVVHNAGPEAMTLLYDAGVNAPEGILFRGSGRLAQGDSASLFYDNTVARWRAIIHRNATASQVNQTAQRAIDDDNVGPVNIYQNGDNVRHVSVGCQPGDALGGYFDVRTGVMSPPTTSHGVQRVTAGGRPSATFIVLPNHFYRVTWFANGAFAGTIPSAWMETDVDSL